MVLGMTGTYTSFLATLLLLSLGSCEIFQVKKEETIEGAKKQPIAQVYDKLLFTEDLEGLISDKLTREDSTNRVENYVKNWVRKQLMISEAASLIDFDEAELERKILDYRYALMIYEFQKYYVNENLVNDITDEQIVEYYEENKDNFELKQNIIKGIYIKLPNDAPRINRLRRWIRSSDEASKEEMRSYCYGFATTYQLEDTVWVNFDDLVKTSPIAEIPDKINFLRRNRYYETSDSTFQYFLAIKDYKISDELSPLEFEKENIANILLNKRKIELARKLEDSIYNKAKRNNEFEIFSEE